MWAMFGLFSFGFLISSEVLFAQTSTNLFKTQVTNKGWRNLRYIETPAFSGITEEWYACGKRKIIGNFLKKPFDGASYQIVIGSQNEKNEYEAITSDIIELSDYINKRKSINKETFMQDLEIVCSSPPISKIPAAINAGVSGEGNQTFYYILPGGFSTSGPERAFWLTAHYARAIQYRVNPETELYKFLKESERDNITESVIAKKGHYKIMRLAILCDKDVIKTSNITEYSEDGNVSSSSRNKTEDAVVPFSVGSIWRDVSCLIS